MTPENGYIKVASVIPSVRVADCKYNVEQIIKHIDELDKDDVEIAVFPELSITGYSCQDLFRQQLLLQESDKALMLLRNYTQNKGITIIVGAPIEIDSALLNCAIVIQSGAIVGIVPKTYLPNYGEFYEKRWFVSAADININGTEYQQAETVLSAKPQIFRTKKGIKFGVEICEDVWSPTPPSNVLALAGADIIFNLSASDELIGKHDYLKSLLSQQSARTISAYVYSSCGFGESTQDVVYGGNALIYENGKLLAESKRFDTEAQVVIAQIDVEMLRAERMGNTTFSCAQKQNSTAVELRQLPKAFEHKFKLERNINPHPFIPQTNDMRRSCEEIFNIQVMGLAKRLIHTNSQRVVVGISGGLDSTLALLVCVRTFDKLKMPRKWIIGVTMPGFGTTDRTYNNAINLMKELGVDIREISIAKSVTQHFEDIGHNASIHDTTYENSQARERTQILMDLSNKEGGLVIGTGDLSELALGWATYNGDHMSMYGVNVSIPKTLIRHLVSYVADYEVDGNARATLMDIIDTPISPELIPADENGNIKQKTEDLVGPYELHDFFIFHFLRYGFSPRKIYMLAQKAFDGTGEGTKYDDETIKKWLKTFCRRFFSQQFKRSCLPDGPKVGSVSLSPRGDWRMPSDANSTLWLAEVDSL